MFNDENSVEFWLSDMVRKGSAATGKMWIEKAIQQRSSEIPLGVASSMLLVYDKMDRELASISKMN